MSAGWFVTLALLSVAAGCVHRAPVPTSLTLRPDTELGTIAVLVHTAPAPARLDGPTTRGTGAAARALDYTLKSFAVGAHDRSGVLLTLAIVASPVTAMVGAIVGATEGLPAEKLKPAREELARAFAEADLADALRARVIAVAREKRGETFVELAPADSDSVATCPVPGRALHGAGTLLELRLTQVRLATPPGYGRGLEPDADPWLALGIRLRLRLVRRADSAELFARDVEHTGPTFGFWTWADDGAARFRTALREAVEALASEIVEDVL